ncbi:aminotransferase class I/II-fold pyridoxal phosphate-dependent enzyme [Fructilactobacillus florum]|uniref:aminotransferase class I/II-fold pyridoxal phosphate-dependent enzyme n=1 Tax=Fructilactobacillus florum TaxID=640331 RepID=UPI00028CB55D|nr:aminotransferase class I/II-fold pyridoxal phosphate-dependent enzyme [Fructilactobacillus florum]EKK20547.1 Aspartate aminotransferase [Fructilactobacillus florum 2F]
MTPDLMKKIKPSVKAARLSDIYQFSEKIADIPGLINLTLGEPDFPTPRHVKDAAIAAINADQSHYTATRGLLETRTAAAQFLRNKYQLDYDPTTQVVITNGVTEAMYVALETFVNPQDEILMPTPAFPVYDSLLELNEARLVEINTANDQFQLTPARLQTELAAHPKAKAIILNFPANPTGVSYCRKQVQELAAVLAKTDLLVISDEIYSELTYDQTHTSIAEFIPAQTLLFNGLSKSHAMTGWRIGVVAGPADIMTEIAKVHELISTSVMTAAQIAATAAFRDGEDDAAQMRVEYERRRDYLHTALNDLGFANQLPQGAFYLFAKIPQQFNQNSYEFCLEVARKARVGLIPGSSFGAGGEGYVRISYATSQAKLEEAVARLKAYVNG